MSEKKILWRVCGIIVIFFFVVACLVAGSVWLIDGWSELAFFVMVIDFVLILGLSYACASFILTPLFRTNHLLDCLLKDTLHELNVPLATIKTNTQLLATTLSEEKNKRRLLRITKAGENLQTLYETLEYYIKREIRLIKEEVFDAKEVVLECLDDCKEIRQGVIVEVILESMLVNTDKIGFKKMVQNVLSNAYKYNKEGGTITVLLHNNQLKISDTGLGMSEETRFHLFDRYYQANSEINGYGIGLSIVKDFCDEYGIFIGLKSQLDRGTDVVLNLASIIKTNK